MTFDGGWVNERPQNSVRLHAGPLKISRDFCTIPVWHRSGLARADLLLGQSFLEHFKSWSIDNVKHELVLEPQ